MTDIPLDNELCLRYIPKNKEEIKILTEIYEIMNKEIYTSKHDPVIFWLVDTKCVSIVPNNSFTYRRLLQEYVNQKEATFNQVKEVALSLMLGINDYY